MTPKQKMGAAYDEGRTLLARATFFLPALATLLVCSGQFIFLMAIEPIGSTGIWYQSEPVIISFLIMGFLSWLLLTAGLLHRPKQASSLIANPAFFLPLAAGLWGGVVAILSPSPGLALLGSPQLGQGPMTFLAAAGASGATLLFIAPNPRSRMLVCWATALSTALLVMLMFLGDRSWQPYFFKDFLVFHALFGWLVLMLWGPRNLVVKLIISLIGIGIVYLSDNRTALGALAIVASVTFLAFRFQRSVPGWVLKTAMVAMPTGLVLISLILSLLLPLKIVSLQGYSDTSALASRAMLIEVVKKEVKENPWRLIVGQGWGHYTQQLLSHLRLHTIKTYFDLSNEDRLHHWDATIRVDFHSHNEVVEALSAGGMPAAALAILPLAFLGWRTRSRRWPVVAAAMAGWAFLQGFWFMLPISLPLMAVATASAGRPLFHPPALSKHAKPWPIICLTIAALLLGAIMVLKNDANNGREVLNHRLDASIDKEVAACDSPLANHARGHLHHANILRRLGSDVVSILSAGRNLREGVVERLDRTLCHARDAAQYPSGLVLGVAAIGVYSDIAYSDASEGFEPIRIKLLSGWQTTLERVLAQAPERTDLAVPYFSWLLAKGDEATLAKFAQSLLSRKGDDPVGLWFSGIVMLAYPETSSQGIERMLRAIDLGIEEVMPLDNHIRTQIKEWRVQ
ncbi:MAG: O-antigen ligase family protein [Alphaproteobacteria bacterium]|nr:O-antigen ligase family protein [Alphaproteobacteria bacterium]